MGQLIFLTVLIFVFITGAYTYLAPPPKAMLPIKDVMDDGGFNSLETLNIKKIEELNVSTSGGLTQIRSVVDSLSQQEEGLQDMINSEQQVLIDTSKKIYDITKKADGKSDIDVLRLKSLGLQLQDDQRLLLAHGQSLIDLNNQLIKTRQWLALKSELVVTNNETLLRLQQQNNALLNVQASNLFDKVKQDNADTMQRAQDSIEEERERRQDQQH
jgi:hypothetical protein